MSTGICGGQLHWARPIARIHSGKRTSHINYKTEISEHLYAERFAAIKNDTLAYKLCAQYRNTSKTTKRKPYLQVIVPTF